MLWLGCSLTDFVCKIKSFIVQYNQSLKASLYICPRNVSLLGDTGVECSEVLEFSDPKSTSRDLSKDGRLCVRGEVDGEPEHVDVEDTLLWL